MQHIYMDKLHADETDDILVVRILAGDREAFGTLVRPYYGSVLRLCIRLLRDPVEAEDIAQEAVLQAFLGLDRLQQPARFGAWLHAIAANLARSALRRQQPLSIEALETARQPGLQHPPRFPGPEQVLALRETHDAILAALMDLSIVNREVVVGFYLQEYSYAELAGLLSVPVSTVKSRLFKGRQQLRQHLEDLREPARFSGARTREEFPMTSELISLQIEMIYEYALTQRSILVLRTMQGERYLPIRLLSEEALAIEHALKSQPDRLSVTYQDTLLHLVSRLGGRIKQVILRSLAKQNYYASLVIAQDGQNHEIDCRLSEALVLAIRARIPILSGPTLLEDVAITLEAMDTDPAVPEVELPDSPEPVTVSDQWRYTFVEQVWSFLLRVLYGDRKPYDLSKLRSASWDELFSAREADWEGKTMQIVQLPMTQPAWLVVRPEVWTQIRRFVDWVQQRDTQPTPETPIFVSLTEEQQKRVERLVEETWPALIALGARTLAIMHLSGRLLLWKSVDSYKAAVRMGRAAVKDLVLTSRCNVLMDGAAEPAIRIIYERSTTFNPAQAAGAGVTSTSEVLIHDSWLLVIGRATDQQSPEDQHQLVQVRASLAEILPD